jgi:predicted translin family RNA/ssDNA-binding protein
VLNYIKFDVANVWKAICYLIKNFGRYATGLAELRGELQKRYLRGMIVMQVQVLSQTKLWQHDLFAKFSIAKFPINAKGNREQQDTQ